MTTLVARLTDIQARLDALARQHGVPGATLAVGIGDELLDFATGVVNARTGVEATTDSIFQIGSNTKLFTTTLVMQLVDEGKIDLDKPVRRYLPSFQLADDTAAREITTRQLLTHTSGIQGDYFQGFGTGDGAIERYVDSLRDVDLVHRPGQLWSYCNTGFVVAGRIAEKLSDAPYHELLQDKICRPLGLKRTTVEVEEMVAHRCAVGHVVNPQGRPVVPPTVVMEAAAIPAGSRTTSTAAELVRFVQMHLHGGVSGSGGRILSEAAVAQMQQVQATMPPVAATPRTQGIGWLMDEWSGKAVIGHGGGTIGQLSFLHALPADDLVVALLTNATTGGLLWRDLGTWLFQELAGVEIPRPLKPPVIPPELPLERYAGTYDRLGVREIVTVDDGCLLVETELSGALAELRDSDHAPPLRLYPIDRERFAGRLEGQDFVVAFLEFERGRPGFLFSGRAARRVTGRSRPKAASSSR
ncbi:MAG: serine hydrolase [Acidimicrobiales bacterium]